MWEKKVQGSSGLEFPLPVRLALCTVNGCLVLLLCILFPAVVAFWSEFLEGWVWAPVQWYYKAVDVITNNMQQPSSTDNGNMNSASGKAEGKRGNVFLIISFRRMTVGKKKVEGKKSHSPFYLMVTYSLL